MLRLPNRPGRLAARIISLTGIVVVSICSLAGMAALAESPSVGARFRDEGGVVRVVDLDPDGAARRIGLELGDTLVEWDGRPVEPLAFQKDPDRIASWSNLTAPFQGASVRGGNPVGAGWLHGGIRRIREIQIGPLGWKRAAWRALPFLLVCWSTTLFAVLMLRRRDTESTRVMAVLAFAVSVCYLCFLPTQARDYALEGCLAWILLAWGYFAGQATLILSAHLGMVLPRPMPILVRHPWLRALPWVVLLATVAEHATRLVDRPFLVSELASMTGISLCVLAMGITWARSKDPVVKAQMRWVFLGFFVGCVPPVLLAYLPLVLGKESILPDSVLIWFVLPLVVGILLSVERYRLLDTGSLLDWTIAHTLALVALAGAESVVWWLAVDRLGDGFAKPVAVVCLATAVFVYAPVRERMVRVLARRSGRRLDDYSEAIRHLLESAVAQEGVGPALESTLRRHPGAASVDIASGLELDFHEHPHGALGIDLGLEDEGGGDLWIPVRKGEGWATCRLVAPLGKSWRREDLRQAWAVLAASSPLFDLEALRRERTALLRELHDGMGNHLQAALVAARGTDEGAARAVMENLEAAVATLGAGFSVLATSPSALAPALVRLLDRMRPAFRAAGAALEDHLDEGLSELSVSPAILVAVVRSAQEALGNALRHSGAARVRLSAGIRPEGFWLRVEDDGRGFDPLLANDGSGIDGIRQRIEGVGGNAVFLPGLPRGSEMEIRIPLAELA